MTLEAALAEIEEHKAMLARLRRKWDEWTPYDGRPGISESMIRDMEQELDEEARLLAVDEK